MTKLDQEIQMSTKMRGELLMDLGGFTYQEKLMMLTSTANDSDFDRIADAMILQHAAKHQREARQDRSQRPWTNRWNGRKPSNVAHLAEECEEDPAIADDAEDHDEYEEELEEAEVNDDIDELELDGISAFISMTEDQDEPEPQDEPELETEPQLEVEPKPQDVPELETEPQLEVEPEPTMEPEPSLEFE